MKMRLPTPGLLRINRLFLSIAFSFPVLSPAQSQNYPGPAYQQPATTTTTGKIQVLADKVAQISANDQRQDIRIYQLERDVDKVSTAAPKPPPSPETGTSTTPQLIPYVPYQVRKGDTLWRIAMNHRISPGDIMGFNRMPNETVVEGQVLMIPQKGGGKAAAASSTPASFHTVQPNETFRTIGKKYNVTSDAIAKANPKVNPAKLMAGARLAIPAGANPPKTAPPQVAFDHGLPAPKPDKTNVTHIVQTGESLSVIAQKHKVTTAAVQKANGITNPNSLRVGQKLIIPTGSLASSKVVPDKKPQTKPPTTPASNQPAAGTGLANAPSYPAPPVKPTPPTPPAPPSNNRGVVAYRMDKGDTIDSVAQMFGTTGAEIRRLNRLTTSSPLHDGDEILVPAMGPVAGN